MLEVLALDAGATCSRACSKSAAEMERSCAGLACPQNRLQLTATLSAVCCVCIATNASQLAYRCRCMDAQQGASRPACAASLCSGGPHHVSSCSRHLGALRHKHAQHSRHGLSACIAGPRCRATLPSLRHGGVVMSLLRARAASWGRLFAACAARGGLVQRLLAACLAGRLVCEGRWRAELRAGGSSAGGAVILLHLRHCTAVVSWVSGHLSTSAAAGSPGAWLYTRIAEWWPHLPWGQGD